MGDLYQEITDWSKGVQSASPPDRIPLNSTPLAYNTAFRNIGEGLAQLGVRPGLKVVNTTAFSTNPHIQFLRLYSYNTGSGYTNYQVAIANDGTLRLKDNADVFSAAIAPPANFPSPSTAITAGDVTVDATVFANRFFLLSSAGDQRALTGSTYHMWGLAPYASWTLGNDATGTSAMPNETYDVAITTYDVVTGAESSLATYQSGTPGGGNRRLTVTISPTAAETARYPYWRVYLRRTTTQASLYQVLTFEDVSGSPIATDGNIPVGTTTVYIDLSAAQIANLTTVAPTTTENNGPPSSARFVATYGRRLIVADTRKIYWSKQDKPDNFPPLNYEPIETGEGDQITGLYPFSDELLLVFTTTAVWGIFGNDPQTWTLKAIDHTIGCASHTSIVEFNGIVAWWSNAEGPVSFDGQRITPLALTKLGRPLVVDQIEQSRLSRIWAGHDPQGSRVIWAAPSLLNEDTLDILFPYNYVVEQWEATRWNPMPVGALALGYIADGSQRCFVGGTEGQVFYFDQDTHNDAVPSGTVSTTFVPVTSSITTIDGTGFYTTGSGLTARMAVITDSDNRPIAKVQIASNTSTELTLTATLTGLTAGATYTCYLGSPDFRLYTKWLDLDQIFIRKRFDRAYLQLESSGNTSGFYLTSQVNFTNESRAAKNIIDVVGDIWDASTSLWDTSVWAGQGLLKKRLPLLRTAHALRLALFHFQTNRDIVVNGVGVLARAQSDRVYGN